MHPLVWYNQTERFQTLGWLGWQGKSGLSYQYGC